MFYLVESVDYNPHKLSKKDFNSLVDAKIINYIDGMVDVRQALNKASVFILPSYCEGISISALKTMAMGRPIVTNNCSMVSLKNLVDFIIQCIRYPKASSGTFFISDDNDISTKDLFAKLTKLFDKHSLLMPVYPKILYGLGVLLGKRKSVDRLCSSLQVDVSNAKSLLDWKPVQRLDDGLKETVEWYKKEHL